MSDGDKYRDLERSNKAFNMLMELAELVRRGEVHIMEMVVNNSQNDPYRMNIDIRTVRGNGTPDNEIFMKYSRKDAEGVATSGPPPLDAMRRERDRIEREMMRSQSGRTGPPDFAALRNPLSDYDNEGNLLPPAQRGRTPQPPKPSKPPEPPKPEIDRRMGARELDLDV